jgi:hypothetical protein
MEWDAAAGQAGEQAGGKVLNAESSALWNTIMKLF